MKDLVFIVDIGNTTISFVVFQDEKILGSNKINTHECELDDIKECVEALVKSTNVDISSFEGGLISSVVPNISRLVQIAVQSVINLELPIIDETFTKYVNLRVDNPKEVGADLLADVAAANKYYPGACFIIDLGTICKFLLLDKNGTFFKTSFFPGMSLSQDSMTNKTALLPPVEAMKELPPDFGTNTIDAMQSGLYYSYVHMIEGYSRYVEKQYNVSKFIITGGNSELIRLSFPNFIFDKDLTAKGILTLYRKAK